MRTLSNKEKFGYGLGDTACNIVFQVVLLFMMFFYTDVFGISAAAAGTMFVLVRLIDAITDPIMGGIADRTSTKWGRYRPYLIWFALPYALLAVLAFTTPEFSETGKLIYAYITYTLLMIVYTVINIPYSALGGVMTNAPNERASLQSWRFALAMAGGAVVSFSLLNLVNYFGEGDEQAGFQYAMVFLSIFALICFFSCFYLTKEHIKISPPQQTNNFSSIKQDFVKMIQNDQWRIIALVSFLILVSVVMRSATTPYYAEYYLVNKGLFGRYEFTNSEFITLFATSAMLAGIAGAVCTNFLLRFICKIALLKLATLAIVVSNFLLFLVPRESAELAFILTIIANFVHFIFTPLMFSTIPDTVDYGRKKLKQSAMAMAFSGHLLMIKLGVAVGGGLTGWILAFSGYTANTEQSQTALSAIVFLYAFSSVVTGILIYFLLRYYKLNKKYMLQHVNT